MKYDDVTQDKKVRKLKHTVWYAVLRGSVPKYKEGLDVLAATKWVGCFYEQKIPHLLPGFGKKFTDIGSAVLYLLSELSENGNVLEMQCESKEEMDDVTEAMASIIHPKNSRIPFFYPVPREEMLAQYAQPGFQDEYKHPHIEHTRASANQ